MLALAAAVVAAFHGGARIQAAGRPDGEAGAPSLGAVEAAAELPDDLDLVLVIDHASALRETPIGQSVRTFLMEAGGLDDMTKAWKGLAQEIGWSEDVAFDRLLGRRVVLASRTTGEGESASRVWAVLSDVSVETEQRLKEKLKAAPRAIDAGHQILSVENGMYELASHRRVKNASDGGSTGKTPETVTLVLGPTGRGELFDQVVRVLAHGAERPLGRLDVVAKARAAGPSELLVLAQTRLGSSPEDPDAADGTPRWRDFVMLSGRRAEIASEPGEPAGVAGEGRCGSTWRTRVLVRNTSRRVDMERIPITGDGSFREMERGALLAVMQSVPLDDVLGKGSPIATVLGALPLPDGARCLVHGRQAVRLRTLPPRDRLLCTVAMETTDAPALARAMDGAVARGIQTVEQRLGALAPPPRNYEGITPTAVRVENVMVPDNALITPLMPEPLAVAWCTPRDGNGLGVGGVWAGDGVGGRPGWWALSVGQAREGDDPTPAAAHEQDTKLISGSTQEGVQARWVCLASARPASIEAMLPALLPDIRNVRSIMRRFDRVQVRLSVTEAGDIQGDITAALSPSAK